MKQEALASKATVDQLNELDALYRLTDRLYRALSLDAVYEAALDAITSTLGCSRASILLFDSSGVMQFVAWRGLSDHYRSALRGHSPWKPGEPDPRPTADRPPPMPDGWRHPRPESPPIRLVGAGRGLFRVRSHPFVDRDAERSQIWEVLKQVHEERSARLIVLSGKAGVGRSRLAEWTARRAHEVGACTIMRATFRDISNHGSGPSVQPRIARVRQDSIASRRAASAGLHKSPSELPSK